MQNSGHRKMALFPSQDSAGSVTFHFIDGLKNKNTQRERNDQCLAAQHFLTVNTTSNCPDICLSPSAPTASTLLGVTPRGHMSCLPSIPSGGQQSCPNHTHSLQDPRTTILPLCVRKYINTQNSAHLSNLSTCEKFHKLKTPMYHTGSPHVTCPTHPGL